jgi:hypothetical protein
MQCPVCKAENTEGPTCRRCKADLSLLFGLESQRDHDMAEARRLSCAGQTDEAARLAMRANGLRSDADSRRLVAVTSLLDHEFERALRFAASGKG